MVCGIASIRGKIIWIKCSAKGCNAPKQLSGDKTFLHWLFTIFISLWSTSRHFWEVPIKLIYCSHISNFRWNHWLLVITLFNNIAACVISKKCTSFL